MQSVSRFALLVYLSAALVAAAALPAYADDARTASSVGIVEAVKTGVAKPTSAWLVGPSQASAFDAKDHPDEQGCLMVAEFDNGMIVGIHARSAGIVGMTVDTKQQTLTPGQPATVGLNLAGDAYVMDAVATDNSTLALSLDQAGGGKKFVERLTSLGNFRLLIDQKPYYFATTGFTDGLARLQECMGANMAVPVPVHGPNDKYAGVKPEEQIEAMKVESSGTQTPLALAIPNLIPTGYRFVLDDVDPMTPISWQAGDDWVSVLRGALSPHGLKVSIKGNTIHVSQRIGDNEPVVETDQKNTDEANAKTVTPQTVGTWTANAGDNLGSVLNAWGEMAGVKVKVDLMGDLLLPHDVKFEGNFNDAVQNLLGQFKGQDKPVSMMSGDNAKTLSAPIARKTLPEKRSTYTTRPDTWKPRSPTELRALEKQYMPRNIPTQLADAANPPAASDTPETGGMKQMATIPDNGPAPKAAPKKASGKKAAVKKVATKPAYNNSHWEALQGTSLRDIFEHWGDVAGVKIVWMTDDNFPLPESINQKGAFADAVAKVMAQYQDRPNHPQALLNADPDTGEKALIIKNTAP